MRLCCWDCFASFFYLHFGLSYLPPIFLINNGPLVNFSSPERSFGSCNDKVRVVLPHPKQFQVFLNACPVILLGKSSSSFPCIDFRINDNLGKSRVVHSEHMAKVTQSIQSDQGFHCWKILIFWFVFIRQCPLKIFISFEFDGMQEFNMRYFVAPFFPQYSPELSIL